MSRNNSSGYYRDMAGTGQSETNVPSGGAPRSLPAQRNVAPSVNGLPVVNEPQIHGHDEVFEPPVPPEYECLICTLCLRDPVQTVCGHRSCKSCIERHMRLNGRRCPLDNQELQPNEVFPDNFVKREINQFPVKCRTVKNNKDCSWKGELQKVEEHLAVCPFIEVACPNACGQNVERKTMETHTKKECQKRKVSCQHCKTDVLFKNLKVHMDRCGKAQVNCPTCDRKMLREKLQRHDRECPKAQVTCNFKNLGCNWTYVMHVARTLSEPHCTGLRLNFNAHIQTNMANHLSLLSESFSKSWQGDRDRPSAYSSRAEAPGSTSSQVGDKQLVELNQQVRWNSYVINQQRAKNDDHERRLRELVTRHDRQLEMNTATMAAMKTSITELQARMSNGIFLWRITGYARHLEDARNGIATAVHSPPFYTSFYGYKLCLRINPNGVDSGYGTHISLFVHMMQSEWDDTLEWPFSGWISMSILDQSDDGEYKRHISETLVTRPNLLAFQRPTTPRNHKGYGYVEFARLETLQDRQYVKNDCLLVRVQVFH